MHMWWPSSESRKVLLEARHCTETPRMTESWAGGAARKSVCKGMWVVIRWLGVGIERDSNSGHRTGKLYGEGRRVLTGTWETKGRRRRSRQEDGFIIGTEVATCGSALRTGHRKKDGYLAEFIKTLFSRIIIVMNYRNICEPCATNSEHLVVEH